tara:strand:- start:1245 stop:1460 length:216 start_codon:yes stop_codon:yes gene_type:complete
MLIISYAVIPDSGVFITNEYLYKDYHTCIQASDEMYPIIYKDYRDSMARCVQTSVISDAPVPKLRPIDLGK